MTPHKHKKILKITNGRKSDVRIAAELMHSTFEGFSRYLFGTDDEEAIIKYFRELWLKKHNRLSSEYSYIVRDGDKPIGLISCYGGSFIDKMFLPTLWAIMQVDHGMLKYITTHPHYLHALLASPEATPKEFYIFMIAVSPEHQNEGIGTQLLKFADEEALSMGYKKCSLLVRRENINAIRFYERNGYKKVRSYRKYPMNFYKMVKQLKPRSKKSHTL